MNEQYKQITAAELAKDDYVKDNEGHYHLVTFNDGHIVHVNETSVYHRFLHDSMCFRKKKDISTFEKWRDEYINSQTYINTSNEGDIKNAFKAGQRSILPNMSEEDWKWLEGGIDCEKQADTVIDHILKMRKELIESKE